MGLATDVLIVAGPEDRVANRLQRDLEQIGRRVAVLDGPSAARLFTIRVRRDEVTVTPAPPMFVRASAWWYDFAAAGADERFLRAEAYATFWAATALSKAVVINRTGPGGGVGRMTAGALATATGTPDAACDIYASGPEFIENEAGDTIWGEDGEFRVGSIAELRRGEPLRARRLDPTALYEIVTVVGNRGFAATTDPRTAELGLAERSLTLCHAIEVHFATITWAIDEQGATPVRLNSAPEEAELRYAWHDVSEALCADLTR
jgi:hypothetical protein